MRSREVLKEYFGYDAFRNGQEELINNILSGGDTVGIMPTGAGKSLCFQVPALIMEGITLVISPLISLMKDQVNALAQSGIKAAFINSSLTENQMSTVLSQAKNGIYKLIYIAPERLLAYEFIEFALDANISMITIDEAHCISQWGQDFRPSYTQIPCFIDKLNIRPVISAFTATATPKVREDIISILRLNNPKVLITGFNRENLYFEVQRPKNKQEALLEFLEDKKDLSGIVYCSTRATVEQVYKELNIEGYKALPYHAGLSSADRTKNQEDFLYDRVGIMVATNAFGMGIDKSNVSFVVHYNMPKDVESYYQEAGRAGRDGERADCLVLYNGKDVYTNLWLIENSRDKEYKDKEAEELLKERDRKRLKEMTFYCTTKDCLRGYILKYFGENPPKNCGNCGSCNGSFEDVDITISAQKILSCVIRLGERYGVNMIIDVLRGSKNERVISLGLDKLSTYNISKSKAKDLREIIDFLIMEGYLIKTDAQYPEIKIGQGSNDVLRGNTQVLMQCIKVQEKNEENYKERSSGKSKDKNSPYPKRVNEELFNILRKLRGELAEIQKVPAYIIFPDITLADMSSKLPTTYDDLLKVSGVGQVKLQRYGQHFIDEISKYIAQNPKALEMVTEENTDTQITHLYTPQINDQPCSVSVIADIINIIFIQKGAKKLSAAKINEWLIYCGYLEIVEKNGTNIKIPTPEGEELGISSVERNIRGIDILMNFFSKEAQEFILENADEISNFKK